MYGDSVTVREVQHRVSTIGASLNLGSDPDLSAEDVVGFEANALSLRVRWAPLQAERPDPKSHIWREFLRKPCAGT